MVNFEVNGTKYIGLTFHEDCSKFIVEDNLLFWTDEDGGDDNVFFLPGGNNYKIIGQVKSLPLEIEEGLAAQTEETLYDGTLIIKILNK